ncbi:MAG: PKD domain-containing protein [Methanospirillaceae archaeon]|nr:PKD domain-containing protein [Methanospirillaceae archaeon]
MNELLPASIGYCISATALGILKNSSFSTLYAIGGCCFIQPRTNFTANITFGTAPLTVLFTDSSTNSPTSWIWAFDDGETNTAQNPSHIYTGSGTYTVSLTATNADGSDTETKLNYITVSVPVTGYDLHLYPGWNFIAVPKTLADGNNTPIWLDQYIDPQAHSMWGYNGETASRVQMMADYPIIPLDGYWLWNAEETTVPLTFKDMGQQLPPTKNLFSGWNAIGFTATVPATARDTLLSVQDAWVSAIGFDGLGQRYENGIINGGTGQFADTRNMYPGHGYWLYMGGDGVLSPLSG